MTTPVTAEDLKARWGKLLQQKREEADLTQLQLAGQMRRDPSTISRIERGKGDLESFLEQANHLGVDLLGES